MKLNKALPPSYKPGRKAITPLLLFNLLHTKKRHEKFSSLHWSIFHASLRSSPHIVMSIHLIVAAYYQMAKYKTYHLRNFL